MRSMFKQDLYFDPPLLNAAGTGGFTSGANGLFSKEIFGGFITNPISWKRRLPASGKRYLPYNGGYLLHTGLSNPGFKTVLKKFSGKWERGSQQIIVHLIAEVPETLFRMVRSLEEISAVTGVEVGFRHDQSESEIIEFLEAASGELPIIARLPLLRCAELAETAVGAGAYALSSAPPRGTLAAAGKRISGRLVGPALWPLQLQISTDLISRGFKIIPSGGITSADQARLLLNIGATAIQLNSAALFDTNKFSRINFNNAIKTE